MIHGHRHRVRRGLEKKKKERKKERKKARKLNNSEATVSPSPSPQKGPPSLTHSKKKKQFLQQLPVKKHDALYKEQKVLNTTKQDEMVGTWPYDHKLTTATATKVREVGGEGGGEGELCTLKHAHTDKQKKKWPGRKSWQCSDVYGRRTTVILWNVVRLQ